MKETQDREPVSDEGYVWSEVMTRPLLRLNELAELLPGSCVSRWDSLHRDRSPSTQTGSGPRRYSLTEGIDLILFAKLAALGQTPGMAAEVASLGTQPIARIFASFLAGNKRHFNKLSNGYFVIPASGDIGIGDKASVVALIEVERDGMVVLSLKPVWVLIHRAAVIVCDRLEGGGEPSRTPSGSALPRLNAKVVH